MANKAAIKRGWHWDEANGYLEAYVNGTQMLSLDDTNSRVQIGTTSAYLDFRIYMGSASKYILFDNSIAYLYLEDTDLKLGDNDVLMFGDGSGGDVRMKWNGSLLQMLPLANDTGYFAIGDGTYNMDLRSYGTAPGNYLLVDAGLNYLSLVNFQLYAPNLGTTGTTAGLVYVNANGYLIQSD